MSYEIDRDPALEPSLVEMAETALTSLEEATKKSKKGNTTLIVLIFRNNLIV